MNEDQTIQIYAILCQTTVFSVGKKKPLKSRKNLAKSGKTWQRKVRKNYVKSIVRMPRQQVAFREECRKIKSCGSLGEDFYTRFKPKNKGFGVVTWLRSECIKINTKVIIKRITRY